MVTWGLWGSGAEDSKLSFPDEGGHSLPYDGEQVDKQSGTDLRHPSKLDHGAGEFWMLVGLGWPQ